jgi:hypothetical protein
MYSNISDTFAAGESLFHEIPWKNRSQTYNPRIHKWVKRDTETGRFNSVKKDGKPYQRVSLETIHRIIHFPDVLSRTAQH